MKKKISMFVSMVFLSAMAISLTVLAQQQFKLMINGKDVKCDMIVKDGVTYLPLRTISNELGMDLQFKDGVINLNSITTSSDMSTSSIPVNPLPPAQTTESKPPVVVQPPANQFDNTPLTSDELLKIADISMKSGIEIYERQGYTVSVLEPLDIVSGNCVKHVLKMQYRDKIKYVEIRFYVMSEWACREIIEYGTTKNGSAYRVDSKVIKEEYDENYKAPSLIGFDENGNPVWLGN